MGCSSFQWQCSWGSCLNRPTDMALCYTWTVRSWYTLAVTVHTISGMFHFDTFIISRIWGIKIEQDEWCASVYVCACVCARANLAGPVPTRFTFPLWCYLKTTPCTFPPWSSALPTHKMHGSCESSGQRGILAVWVCVCVGVDGCTKTIPLDHKQPPFSHTHTHKA